jgi:anaerobic selenocysteine-containing dehydrogenase
LADPLIIGDVDRLSARLADYAHEAHEATEAAEATGPNEARNAAAGATRPLRLIGRRQARNMNSWLHNVPSLAKGRPRCTLLIHPDDAKRRGLAHGERARVQSRVGQLDVEVEVSDEMMPGVVSLPHGFGHARQGTRLGVAVEKQPGVNANALTDDQPLDVPSGTSVANGIPVEVSSL